MLIFVIEHSKKIEKDKRQKYSMLNFINKKKNKKKLKCKSDTASICEANKTFNTKLILLLQLFFTLNLCAFIRLFVICGAFHYLRDAILRKYHHWKKKNVFFSEIIIGNFFCDIQQVMVEAKYCVFLAMKSKNDIILRVAKIFIIYYSRTQIKKYLVYIFMWHIFLLGYLNSIVDDFYIKYIYRFIYIISLSTLSTPHSLV